MEKMLNMNWEKYQVNVYLYLLYNFLAFNADVSALHDAPSKI